MAKDGVFRAVQFWVRESSFIFNCRIRKIIALGGPAFVIEAVMASAKLGGAQVFILKLSHRYDTQVKKRGVPLSGGPRKRIAFARAPAVNPKILIFDEAAPALDYDSEATIMAAME